MSVRYGEGLLAIDRLVVRKNGIVVWCVEDLVVATGLEWIAQRMTGSGNPMNYMAIGIGLTDAAAGDTALETETARVALNIPGGASSGASAIFDAEFPPGVGTGSITEVGVFDAETGGAMLCRKRGAAIDKLEGDSLVFTWSVEMSAP